MSISEYQEFGWKDDSPEPYHFLLTEYIKELLPSDGKPVLDVGCGNGFLANKLNDAGFSIYGIDASAEGIEIANRRYIGRFFVCDVASNQLPEGLCAVNFKTVISTEVIEHLYNPRLYVKFIRSILANNGGGTFLVSTPYHGYLKNLALALAGKMDYHYSALWEGGHIKFWSHKTLSRLLHEAGFVDIKFYGVGRCPYLWRHMIMSCKVEG